MKIKKGGLFTSGLTFVRNAKDGTNALADTSARGNAVSVKFTCRDKEQARKLAKWIEINGMTFGTIGMTFPAFDQKKGGR